MTRRNRPTPVPRLHEEIRIPGDEMLVALALSVAQAHALSEMLRTRLSHPPRTRLEHDLAGLRDFLAEITGESALSTAPHHKETIHV